MAEARRDGDNVEKKALESRCERGANLLENEIRLRITYEDKAKKCDRLEEETQRMIIEVRMRISSYLSVNLFVLNACFCFCSCFCFFVEYIAILHRYRK